MVLEMSEAQKAVSNWKHTLVHETGEYFVNFVYLAFFFAAFAWYRRLVLDARGLVILDWGVPLIEAAVLAKFIMILGMFHFGRRLENKPLIVPTLYKTAVFSVWIAVFGALEHTLRGLIHGRGVTSGFEELVDGSRYELLARCLVKFLALVPFFAFKEIGRVLGKGKLRALFWQSGARFQADSHDQGAVV
jgi:hypothetical protein